MLPDRLRTGRKVGRTIYVQAEGEPSDADALIGVMDTRELAAEVVARFNLPSLSLWQIDWLRALVQREISTSPEPVPLHYNTLADLGHLRAELTTRKDGQDG